MAIVGTVVNQTLTNDISTRLPAHAAQQLTPTGLKYATDPQILVNQGYRDNVVHSAQRYAVQGATAHIPPGPQRAAVTAQVSQQVQHLLNQVFDALKFSLTVAIQHGIVTILIFSVAMVVAAFFLKDVPLSKARTAAPNQAASKPETSPKPEMSPQNGTSPKFEMPPQRETSL
ncbi:hypothetical protein [Dictyobacter halimunensis]|uniref:hypothetical protein n=1 Tax=Dictyobacter halimunensis TaxID=3026934 RepID=UPI0030C6AF81